MSTHEYLFDLKLFASLRVKAATEEEARAKLDDMIDCASCTFGTGENGHPIVGELSMDEDGGADLIEVDGEEAL